MDATFCGRASADLLNQGMDKKEAMKRTAKDRGVSKRDIYQEMIGKKGEI